MPDDAVPSAAPGAEGAATGAQAGANPRSWRRWAGLAVGVVALAFIAPTLGDALPRLFAWVEGLGAWGPIAFVALYIASTVLALPASLVTLAGGAIFGLAKGFALSFTGAMIGSGTAFLIGRYLARHAVEERIARSERFSAIDRAVGVDGLKMVSLLRLSPVFPFSFMNYALGLTAVRFRDYMLAGFAMIPGTLLYVYYGKVAGDLAQLATGVPQERGAAEWAMLLLGLVATLAVTVVVTRRARAALRELDEDVEAGGGAALHEEVEAGGGAAQSEPSPGVEPDGGADARG